MNPHQVAKLSRKIHRALLQSPRPNGALTPTELASLALAHSVTIESALERYLAECDVAEPVETVKRGQDVPLLIERIDPSNPDSWPDADQSCRYALYDPLCESEDVPGWVIGEGVCVVWT